MYYIGLDFDGTCTTHEYPIIGRDIGAIPVLKKILKNGHKIVLNTMRSGDELQQAVDWLEEREISLFGVNNNPTQSWTKSPKVYANLYIDDAALGCPLIVNNKDRPYVDWPTVENKLESMGII